jgi:outer membrane protein assembly factor BamB
VASVDGRVHGLDAATGRTIWTAKGEGMYQSRAATDDTRFFVAGWDNHLRALDVRTGRELWKAKFGRSFYFAPAIGSPAVGDGKVFVTSNDGVLHAVEAETGRLVWEVAGPALGYSGPLYRDGRVYNASLTDDGRVLCFDARTGAKLWETATGAVIYDSSCAWGGGNIYVSSVNGTFSALRAADGRLAWQRRLGPGHVFATPATDDARVYIGSMSGRVTALPLDGAAR